MRRVLPKLPACSRLITLCLCFFVLNISAKNTNDICIICNAPSSLAVTNVTSTSVNLQWNENNNPNAILWDIEVVEYGSLPTNIPTHSNVSNNPFVLTGLVAATRYQFYVRARCVGVAPSAWSVPFTFSTLLPNPTPCGIGMAIPDNSCSSANSFFIEVNTPLGNELGNDVIIDEIRIIIEHPWVADMEIFLTSPSGIQVELSTDNGNSGDHYGDPFDTTCGSYAAFTAGECGTPLIETSMPPFVGKYIPENSIENYNDLSDPNGIWMLEICDDAGSDEGTLAFFEIVFTSNVCFQPSDLMANNITATSLDVSWNDNGNCNETIIEYGPTGFTPGSCSANTGTILTIPCPAIQPFQITGLTESTAYDFYIRKDCGAGGCSTNSCPVSITTDCLTNPVSESENFENQMVCATTCGTSCPITGNWFNTNVDDFDWVVSTGTTPSFNTGPDQDVSSIGNYIYLETSGNACSGGKKAELRSNCFAIDAANGNCHLSFYDHIFGGTIGSLMLEISTDGGVNWINLWTTNGSQGDFWEKNYVDLSAFDGQIVQFRFLGISGIGFTGDIAIDEIELYGSIAIGAPQNTYFVDADGDGYGNAAIQMQSCNTNIPTGYVANGTDCNDGDATIHPGADEVACNGQDENCNGNIDDTIFSAPGVNSAFVCQGETTTLIPTFFPEGTYYWYNSPTSNTPIATGNSFTTPILNNNTTYYLIDSTTNFPGLRISEIDLGAKDIIEIQNVGSAADYTGWFVALSNNYTNINSVNSTPWNLGTMASNEIAFRSDDATTGANYLGSNIIWNAGSYPTFAGWAILVDNTGNVADAVFWGWQSGSISNFDINVNGFNITNTDLPWNGNGVDVSSGCAQGNTIALIGTSESNSSLDYANCTSSTISTQNLNLDLKQICSSNRVPIEVEVDEEPNLIITSNTPSICAGTPFDLSTIDFIDTNDADGITSYHTGTPTSVANYLSSSIVNPTIATTYYVRSSTASGCFDETPIIVDVNNSMNVSINPVGTINACEGSNKTITGLTLGSGTAPYTYLWNTGVTTESITASPNPQGGIINYAVTITDANGCFGVASMNINSYTISASIDNILPVSNCNGEDGKITLTPFGTPPYSYTWNGPNSGSSSGVMNSFTIPNLQQGAYRVTISDDAGCDLVIPQSILSVGGPAANATLESKTSITCPGANNGSIDIAISGNNPTAIWSNGSTSEDLTNLAPGSYDVTVSDGQCTSILTGIVIEEPELLTINIDSIRLPDCVGDNSGAIQIEVTGGNPPYNYNWNTGNTSQNISGLQSGNYNVMVTDAYNCLAALTSITVGNPIPLDLVVNDLNAVSCFGADDGTIELSVTGGTEPYTYNWSHGAVTKDVNALEPNTYQVTITDANDCSIMSNTVAISGPPMLFSITNEVTQVACFGELSGAIEVTTNGGLPPYTYAWSNGSSMANQGSLSAGNYQYTVTDANGCHLISPLINVTQSSAISLTIDNISNITCPEDSNGYIQMTTAGGVEPYTYAWSNGHTLEDANDLPVGNYDLTVTDANNCSVTSTVITLNEVDALLSNISEVVQISCYGAKDGKVDVEVVGGLEPYSFLWNSGQTTKDLNNLEPGNYTVTIVDAGGCTHIHTTSVTEPIPLQPEVIDLQHVTCVGESDAMIQIFTNGGIVPLTYAWSNGDSGSIASSLSAGYYDVTVTDAFGCQEILANIPIVESDEISIDVANLEQINCAGANDGMIDITVIGGVGPFTYQWSNGNITEDLINVGADDYSLTLTDANGCKQYINVISLFEPQSVLATNDINSFDVSCHDADNGQVIVDIIGGIAPYQYNWSAGQNNISNAMSDTISNLGANTYDVTVTDANGCIHVSPSLTITAPTQLILTVDNIVNNDCINSTAGQIDISSFGGQPPYTYHWSNGNQNEDQQNLTTGTYSVYIEDAVGCTSSTAVVEIEQPGVNLDYNLNIVNSVTCIEDANGMINVTSFGGTAPYSYAWNNGATGFVINNLSGGFYFASVTDANGCQHFIDTIEIQEAAESLEVDLLEIYGNDCVGNAAGAIDIQIAGGISPYNITWNNNQSTEDLTALESGIYNATITDALGCITFTPNYFVAEPDPFQLNMISNGSPSNMNIGSLQVMVDGGTAPYQYQWDENANNQTTNLASGLAPGVYHVTITDANNCMTTYNGAVGFITSTENEVTVNTFEIFPNPTNSEVNVRIQLNQNQSFELRINDFTGKMVKSIPISATQNFEELIDIAYLSQGVYIMELHFSEHEIIQQKLVVINNE